MSEKKILIFGLLLTGIWLLMSNANGVPQAVTKAPGEANHNSCSTCHDVKGNFEPTISLDVMKFDSTIVHSYNPGEIYLVRIKVSATNNPKAYGFQMSCLDSLTNNDAGVWSGFGEKVKQQTLLLQQKQRKYLVQSSPKTDGIFTAQWKAPASDVGKIKFYFTGLAVNLNGNTNGDNNVFDQLTLNSPSTSSSEDVQFNLNHTAIYPNPAYNFINIGNPSATKITLKGLSGGFTFDVDKSNNTVDISNLPIGMYILVLQDANGKHLQIKKLIKI